MEFHFEVIRQFTWVSVLFVCLFFNQNILTNMANLPPDSPLHPDAASSKVSSGHDLGREDVRNKD